MNKGQINGFAVNAASGGGSNAWLSGGIVASLLLSASLVSGAVLTGGIENTPYMSGRVSLALQGGASCSSSVDAKYFMTARLMGGVPGLSEVQSNLGRAPGLVGGVEDASTVGGQLQSSPRLQSADTVGDTGSVSGGVVHGSGLNGGLESTGFTSASLQGGAYLGSGGVHSIGDVFGEMNTGLRLVDGADSGSFVDSTLVAMVLLQGGILGTHTVGHEIDISPRLQDGIIQVGAIGSPVLRISPHLNGGLGSNSEFSSGIRLSSYGNFGVFSASVMSGAWRIGVLVSGGAESTNTTNSAGIAATQTMAGAVYSASGVAAGIRVSLDGALRAGVRLQDSIHTTGFASGSLVSGAMLQGTVQSGSAIDGALQTSIPLTSGFTGTDLFDSRLVVSAQLDGGLSSDHSQDGAWRIGSVLSDGVTGDCSMGAGHVISARIYGYVESGHAAGGSQKVFAVLSGGTGSAVWLVDSRILASNLSTGGIASGGQLEGGIVQGFLDPLLNNWALEIRSATQILSIDTPLQDT